MPSIVLDNVGKQYRRYHAERPRTFHETILGGWKKIRSAERFWALKDVSVIVEPGETLGVIGKNGAGKSTLLKTVSGVLRPDEGNVRTRGRVCCLFNLGGNFHAELTGRENIRMNGVIAGLTISETMRRFDEIVAFAEAEEYIDNPVRTYSSGMMLRLAFSLAIHTDPEILIVDEALAVGDLEFERKCLNRVKELRANGCAIVLASHGMQTVINNCDKTIWLHQGRVMASGKPIEVVDRYLAAVGPAPTTASTPAPALASVT